jgi:hypothetical protein
VERSVLFVRTADASKLKLSSFNDFVGHDVAVVGSFPPGSSEHPLLSPELFKFLLERHNLVEASEFPKVYACWRPPVSTTRLPASVWASI